MGLHLLQSTKVWMGRESTGLDKVGSSLKVKGRGVLVKEGGKTGGMQAVEGQSRAEGRKREPGEGQNFHAKSRKGWKPWLLLQLLQGSS